MDDRRIVRRHSFEDLDALPDRRPRSYLACPSCRTRVRQKSYSLRCRSCGASLVGDADFAGHVPPDGVLPFEVDRAAAKRTFTLWLRSRRFAPGSLRVIRRAEEIEGVYFPFWSFSAQTSTSYSGQRGVERYRSDSRSTTDARGNRQTRSTSVSYVEWQRAKGHIDRYFDGILVPGCSTLPDKLPEWPAASAEPYAVPSVEGFGVVPYDIEPETGFAWAKKRMGQNIDRDIRADIGGSQQRIHSFNTAYHRSEFKLLLLPAWLISYSHRGVVRTALVNGYTGAIVGDRPYSGTKIALVALAAALVVAAAVLFAVLR